MSQRMDRHAGLRPTTLWQRWHAPRRDRPVRPKQTLSGPPEGGPLSDPDRGARERVLVERPQSSSAGPSQRRDRQGRRPLLRCLCFFSAVEDWIVIRCSEYSTLCHTTTTRDVQWGRESHSGSTRCLSFLGKNTGREWKGPDGESARERESVERARGEGAMGPHCRCRIPARERKGTTLPVAHGTHSTTTQPPRCALSSLLPLRRVPQPQRIRTEPLRRVCALPAAETHCPSARSGGQARENRERERQSGGTTPVSPSRRLLLFCRVATPWPHRGCDLMHME